MSTPALRNLQDTLDIPQGARSPAESERSTFTSISQRGINPRWAPPQPPPGAISNYGGNVIPRRPVNRTADILLDSNPDFELPGRTAPSRKRGGGGYPPI
ncbi:hypothetical protein B0H67DRAFT_5048 [Lasiosphaeris hirsuta]|uniref:Uncharacterized protein n=1 Tax=Lasiosphaeris hirsuta TaxID=260670 RepID=A0AA40B8N7_9PEZI|nr:hypothetical protein B0H67DRAFT_5048 [Lasiosphaeris hirsuta]